MTVETEPGPERYPLEEVLAAAGERMSDDAYQRWWRNSQRASVLAAKAARLAYDALVEEVPGVLPVPEAVAAGLVNTTFQCSWNGALQALAEI